MKLKSVKMALCLVAAALMMAACQDKESYASLIPEDSFYTLRIDQKALVEKAGIDQSDPLVALLKMMTPNLRAVLENPMESGIDVTKPIYSGMTGETVLVVAKGSDANKLKNLFESFGPEVPPVEQDGERMMVNLGDEGVIVWDDKVVAMAVGKNAHNDLKAAFEREEKTSIVANKEWQRLKKEGKDLTCYINLGAMPASVSEKLAEAEQQTSIQAGMSMQQSLAIMKEMQLGMTYNFEKGQMVGHTYTISMPEEYKIEQHKITKELLKQLPANTVGLFAANLDGNAAVEQILKIYPDYEKQLEPFKREMGLDFLSMMRSIDGGIALNVTGVSTDLATMGGQLIVETSNDTLWQVMETAFHQIDNNQGVWGDKTFRIEDEEEGMFVVMGQDANRFYLALNAEYPFEGGLEKTDIAKRAVKSPSYFYLDFAPIAPLCGDYSRFVEPFDYMECAQANEYDAEMVIGMVDKEQNALKTIYQMVLQAVM